MKQQEPWATELVAGWMAELPDAASKTLQAFAETWGNHPAGEPDRMRYRHLHVLHRGQRRTFASVATHKTLQASSPGGPVEPPPPIDLVLVEPPLVSPTVFEADPIPIAVATGAPIVFWARAADDLDSPWAVAANLIITEDDALAAAAGDRFGAGTVMQLRPSVDAHVWNPSGWNDRPTSRSVFAPRRMWAPGLDEIWDDPSWFANLTGGELERHPARLPAVLDTTTVATMRINIFKADVQQRIATLVAPRNGVSQSDTASMILQIAAAGGPVVTTAPGLDLGLLPADAVPVVSNETELRTLVDHWAAHPIERARTSVRQRREVLRRHTTIDRFEEILERLDLPRFAPPTISILLSTNRPDFVEHAIANVDAQRYPDKELILILHGSAFGPEHPRRYANLATTPIRVVSGPDSWTLGDCLNAGLDLATGDLITKMDDDDYYEPAHLDDLVTTYRYSDAMVVGKRTNFTFLSASNRTVVFAPGWEEQQTKHIPGATLMIGAADLRRFRFQRVRRHVDTDSLLRIRAAGGRLYSTHRFNFTRVRHDNHTFDREDQYFIDHSTDMQDGFDRASTRA